MLENELAASISLNGEWQIEFGDQRGTIRVPGAWEAQGYSLKLGVREPAVYRRSFEVPAEWFGLQIRLSFGAVSYYAEVLVNDVPAGSHEGMWTPFEFDISHAVRAGETNTLEVRVVKPGYPGDLYPYRDVLGGFLPYVSDNFGGIWQDVTLTSYRAPAFDAITVAPSYEQSSVTCRFQVMNVDVPLQLVASLIDGGGTVVAEARQNAPLNEQYGEVTLEGFEARHWPEALYTLTLRLEQADTPVAQTTRAVGFRKLSADGDKLNLNGEPIHVRGALSWGWDPNTLAPIPTDDEVRDEFRRVREMGFNMVKLCLFVPPENVFRIADEEGMLLWLELPLWLPNLSDHLREQARIEYADILRRVHHHPSVVIYSLGCELGADMADAALLDALNSTVRGSTSGVLVCDNSGSGEAFAGLTFDYADFNDYHFYADLHYFTPLLDLFRRDWRPARPLIFGEFCDADDYRDPAALLVDGNRPAWRDFLGVEGNLSRWAYSVQESLMAPHNLPFTDAQIAAISRGQSFVVRKTILERTRLRGDIGGYVLTGLRDTPVSSSGVFDDAGRAKYDAAEFRQFNSDAVLLLEGGRARRWTNGGDRPLPADLHNHRSGGLGSFRIVLTHVKPSGWGRELTWRLSSEDGEVRGGTIHIGRSVSGSPVEIARLEFMLPPVTSAQRFTLAVSLDGTLTNHWPIWIYPEQPPLAVPVYDPAGALAALSDLARADLAADSIMVAGAYTPELDAFLRRGGRAVLIQNGAGALPTQGVPFWRESIKLLCDHPVMNRFPHQGYADLQFYHLATDHAFDVSGFGFADMQVTPVMRRLDARLFTVLDYLVEAEVGQGRLFATTLRLFGGAGDQAWGREANVAGDYLLRLMLQALNA